MGVAVALLSAVAVACEKNGATDKPPPGGTGGASGVGGIRPDGGGGGGGGTSEVRVAILSPKAMEVVRIASAAEVRARVQSFRPGTNDPAADPIDPTSIEASLRVATTNAEVAKGPLFGPMPESQFAAPFDLSKVPTGDYLLIVSGATTGGTRGVASVPVRVDAGPSISIVSPKDGGSFKGGVTVQVVIDSAPFGPTMNVEATIATLPIPLAPSSAPNTWETPVDFLGFPTPLTGEQVLKVTAVNAAGTRSQASARFTVDNKGPGLAETDPKEGVVVGGIIRIRAKVQDPSGVLGNSVIAVIGNRKDVNYKVELKPEGETGFFSALFDTARLTSCRPAPDPSLCIVLPNLSFRASDFAGNESVVAYDIAVDNAPPIVDLFPPPDLRIARYSQSLKRLICSHAFDPLGDYRILGDMPNDLCAAPQVFDLRARIEDAGNRADGLKHSPISGVDTGTTAIYVQGDTSQPLVVDVDADGVCDQINPMLVPTTKPAVQSNEVLTIRMVGVPVKGAADFTPDPLLMTPGGAAAYPGCSPGLDPLGPRRLCGSEPLTVVIGSPAARGPTPAIYALEPITQGEPLCVGSQFDSYANEIPEGWACIAAAATDKLGNSATSQPMRVWIQRRGLPPAGPTCPGPPPTAGPPPACTGTFDRKTGALSAQPCVGRAFPAREILNEGALPEGPGAGDSP
jgi:hypothetical protein